MRFLRRILSFNDRRQQQPEGQNDVDVNSWEQKELAKENSIPIHVYGILTEYIFVILPGIALVVVFSISNNLSNLSSTPEVSFAASILFGQTIVKIASILSIDSSIEHREPLALASALLMVLGLVPSVIVWVIILNEEQQVGIILQLYQTVLFIIASLVFVTLGSISAKLNYEGQLEKARKIVAKEAER